MNCADGLGVVKAISDVGHGHAHGTQTEAADLQAGEVSLFHTVILRFATSTGSLTLGGYRGVRARHRTPGAQSCGGFLPGIGCRPHRAGALAGRIGDLPRRIFRPAEPTGRPALDAVADVAVPGRPHLLPGGRLRRCGLLDASARCRRCVTPDLASPSTGPGPRADSGVRRAGFGRRGGFGRLRGCRFDAGVRRLGRGDAPVVPRRVPGGGIADADCDCRATPVGAFGARGTGAGGCGGGRRHPRRPRALPRLGELPDLLGSVLPARNRLAWRPIGRSQTRADRRRLRDHAGVADLAGTLSGQHDRRSRPDHRQYDTAQRGVVGVRLRTGRNSDRTRAGAQPRIARPVLSSGYFRWPTTT